MKFILLLFMALSITTHSFQVRVENVSHREAAVYIAVFDQKEGFPYRGEMGIFKWVGSPAEAERGVSTGLPGGEYAVVVFQDIDGNGRLTRWFFGKPREPYGILGAVEKPRRKPVFSESSKRISEDSLLQIKLWEP